MEEVQRNGYIRHKMEKTEHPNKISKQVNTLQIERLNFKEWITSCDSLKAYVNRVLLSVNVYPHRLIMFNIYLDSSHQFRLLAPDMVYMPHCRFFYSIAWR